MSDTYPRIDIDRVSYFYGSTTLFKDVSFSLDQGEGMIITGESGAGKSTLLRICAAIERPHNGRLFLNGRDVTDLNNNLLVSERQRMGFVFQNNALISFLPVFENIAMPLRYHRLYPREAVNRIVSSILERLDIERLAYKRPEELSRGESKLVAIARALVMEPDLLFLDEPLSGIHSSAAEYIIDVVKEIKAERSITILMISHILGFIKEMGLPVVTIYNRGLKKGLYLKEERGDAE